MPEGLSLNPVADRLSSLLDMEVKKTNDCIGSEVQAAIADLGAGEILLLEIRVFILKKKTTILALQRRWPAMLKSL